jgi:uncharacterized protein
MRKSITIFTVIVCALAVLFPNMISAREKDLYFTPNVAIVIDDFGSDMEGTEDMMNLPFPITAAVMPFLPTTKRDAEWAHHMGHEVIVHLPMEPFRGKKSWLGPGAITCDLEDDEIRNRVHAAIDNVPYAIGINNHMGSKATVDERVMKIVLEVCQERGLFFLDSHTNYRSVVSKLSKTIGVASIENHYFLDDRKNKLHVAKQMKLIQKCSEDQMKCVAIGHVGAGGKITAEVLKDTFSRINNVQFVGISKVIQ